ncbi:hypothetical protein LDO26_11660 [Luteimonas sp. BDR2-5]|uniref:hypothetical protein n=1 Tax=Proluteimonas luteida TaxID=2878685 RepID=UPI001E28DEA6|nr:hypothetical protein [Luteimonas sp. BDR2-5]MCD9028863.1 hypothetical protein [Luteimonas sp. BDR2-5]
MTAASPHPGRLHVPLPVHDAMRRGRPVEAVRLLRAANPGLGLDDARTAIERLARYPSSTLEDDDPYRPTDGAAPADCGTVPTEVAAKIATGNTGDAARRLREAQPGLSESEARDTVERLASPLLQEARTETVVRGDSGRHGWLGWVLLLVALGVGLALLSGGAGAA